MVFRKKNINFSGDMNGQQLKSSRPLAEEVKEVSVKSREDEMDREFC